MRYVVLGAGKQGTAIIDDIVHSADGNRVIAADSDPSAVEAARRRFHGMPVEVHQVDLADPKAAGALIEGAAVCVSALPYFLNLDLARAAVQAGVHFCDLGGNTDIVRQELALDREAREKGVHVVPDCGLSPGMTNILAAHVISQMERVDRIEMRVGGLPANPKPPLNYQLVFSVHGLLNEYIEPAIILEDGVLKRVPSMTGVETVRFDGYPEMEAFYTFGGISTLPDSLGSRVPNLNEKTVRYKGHAEAMNAILKDPRFASRREIAEHLLSILPQEGSDIVLARVSAIGTGRRDCELIDHFDPKTGFSAMMRTTGFSAAIIATMMADGRLGRPGAHMQETVVPTRGFIQELAKRNIIIKDKAA